MYVGSKYKDEIMYLRTAPIFQTWPLYSVFLKITKQLQHEQWALQMYLLLCTLLVCQ